MPNLHPKTLAAIANGPIESAPYADGQQDIESIEEFARRIALIEQEECERENADLRAQLEAARKDAGRYRWLLNNSTRMSEPLYARGTSASPIVGHRVSLIADFDGNFESTPWATQETFAAAIDAAIREAKEAA